ncbi:DUF6864 domain-containing function [Vibrio parahaemolyticus]|uniref:DUF6864 domain-containing function n=1 Tax=Vibrio parahaemolyticus TaxID=670 RepID=UPI00111DE5CF|nr:hypothetical protein [Vibrio parahaemolyticus]EJG0913753.1 hypothetical protein [Vibrio parahaemolyticus]TOM28084.1 hypothetical protein CGH80_24045 [Vibrio parahaemolyticus]TOM38145.1 hypothetical protein CGH77_23810 [Vibrio parahaemolyticus]
MNNYGIPITVSTNGLEVISSGIVHLTTPELTFKIDNLTLKFEFKEDDKGGRYEGKVEDNILKMTLFNFKNSLGEGNPDPIPIASVKGKQLYITYYVNSFNGGEMREFHYTFMLGAFNG